MKVTKAQSTLSMYGGASAARAEAIATELRSAGLLPKGGRGQFAPDASEAAVAAFALAVAGAEKVADAVETIVNLSKLVDRHGAKLLAVLAHALGNGAVARSIRHIRVLPVCNMAEVTYRSEGKPDIVERFFPPEAWVGGFVPEAQGQGFAGRIGHIGGAVIAQLAIEFSEGESDGEIAE